MVDFVEAIKKPFTDIQTLIIGIIIGLIPIVSILMSGYGIKTASETLKGNKSLVNWFSDIGDLIVKSILAIIIGIIYFIPFIIVLGIGVASLLPSIISMFSSGAFNTSLLAGLFATGGIFLLIAFIVLLVIAFIFPMALVFYARTGNFGDAFKFGEIFSKAFSGKYFISWIVAIIWDLVLAFIVGLIALIPIAGVFIAIGLTSYATTVTSMSIFAETYNELK